MSDPKDELSARFEDRAPGEADGADKADDTGESRGTNNLHDTHITNDTGEPDATRNRRQMPMYLPEAKIEAMNRLYDRLDARSKLADEGGIEKHKDFMKTVAEFAIENEDELACRLGLKE